MSLNKNNKKFWANEAIKIACTFITMNYYEKYCMGQWTKHHLNDVLWPS